jgi:ATP-dependent DNA helicase PIF1
MLALKNILYAINNGTEMNAIATELNISLDTFKAMITSAIESKYPDGLEVKQFNQEIEDANEWNRTKEVYQLDDTSDDSGYDTEESKIDPFDKLINSSPIPFSDEQLRFMQLAVKERKNIALLAPAGYGKSFALSMVVKLFRACVKQDSAAHFLKHYKYCHPDDASDMSTKSVVHLCASTGKAASLLNGARTLHSLLGIGVARGEPEQWFKKVSTAKYLNDTYNIIRSAKCFIIDEISMISAELLDKISKYLQIARQDTRTFGGLQFIIVGDFCQLNPVRGAFAFRSFEYKNANFTKVQFTKCFRQKNLEFTKVLNELRFGNLSKESYKILEDQTSIDEEYVGNLKPTLLCATNAEVDTINKRELAKLCKETDQKVVSYDVLPVAGVSAKKADAFRKIDGIPDGVDLAVGAQVMITFNLSQSLINGTQGIITALKKEAVDIKLMSGGKATVPYIGYKDPESVSVYDAPDLFSYMPLRLSYAITVHKAQGSTLELLEIDCKRIFCHGQLYVAVSRVTDLRGLIIKNLSKKAIICDKAIKEFYSQV